MTLPRFTSGSLGRLTFADINEICEAAEVVQKFAREYSRAPAVEPVRQEIWAVVENYITGTPNGAMPFYEVELDPVSEGVPPTWRRKTNGIVSGSHAGGTNPNYYPCYSTRRTNPPHVGNIQGLVRLSWQRSTQGRGYWLIVDREQRTGAFPARIIGYEAVASTNPVRYYYRWKEQTRGLPGTGFSTFNDFPGQMWGGTGAPLGSETFPTALNGAEYASIPSGTATNSSITRLPIAIGEVVQMGFDVDGATFFHARNEYLVACLP